MSGLDNLNKRLKYYGENADKRLINDKLRSLKSALYSYQSQTVILANNKEFKCLINPNKETGDYDNKIISIPYEDLVLDEDANYGLRKFNGVSATDIKCGDVVEWKETETHWLVFLQYLEEKAYFRAQIRRCDQQTTINDKTYWIYMRGPVETDINWNQKGGIEWNDLNFSQVLYITNDDNTYDYITRFAKLRITDTLSGKLKTWQVAGVNPVYGDGIIQVFLNEYFENSIELAEQEAEKENEVEEETSDTEPYIEGPSEVSGYSTVTYTIKNTSGGVWYLKYNDVIMDSSSDDSFSVDINMKKGTFTIEYYVNDEAIASKEVTVKGF